MISIMIMLLVPFVLDAKTKILHLSLHRGCIAEIQRVAAHFDLDITSIFIQDMPSKWLDGHVEGNNIYNISHDVAKRAWDKHETFFDQFDGIITSDTAPRSRIFLQNNWKKPLIIWICNRFDYYDQGSNRTNFPDPEYYQLFSQATKNPYIRVVPYTDFEAVYAQNKGITVHEPTIKPCTLAEEPFTKSSIPTDIVKTRTFFLPPYQNETVFMNLAEHCKSLQIPAYCGRYNGPQDLKGFKGIIHLPYALSNLALFENIQLGIIYFVPSLSFIKKLSKQGRYWFQDIGQSSIEQSEWYKPENAPLFVYFDSWKDLQHKITTLDYETKKRTVLYVAQNHKKTMLNRWNTIFKELNLL